MVDLIIDNTPKVSQKYISSILTKNVIYTHLKYRNQTIHKIFNINIKRRDEQQEIKMFLKM